MKCHDRGDILIFRIIGGPAFQDIFVKLYDGFCESVCDNLEEIWRFISSSSSIVVIGEMIHYLGSDVLQVPSGEEASHNLNHYQHYHCQPVEHVMHCGCREGSLKLISKIKRIGKQNSSVCFVR